MKSYIKMVFDTSAGKEISLTVPDVDENVADALVSSSMTKIKDANAIDGVDNIVAAKSATLYKVTLKPFAVA